MAARRRGKPTSRSPSSSPAARKPNPAVATAGADGAGAGEEPQTASEVKRHHDPNAGRFLVFCVLYASYAGYYLCKKNYAFWLQHVIMEFDVSLARAGTLASGFEIASGTAKIVLAVWVDSNSPRWVLGGALLGSVGVNVAMYAVSVAGGSGALGGDAALLVMTVLWSLNGVFQALGWPALARIFMAWFRPSERGTWYSLLSTNQNAGAAIVPLIIAPVTELTGSWRAGGFLAPAFVAFVIAVLVFAVLADEPPSRRLSSTADGASAERSLLEPARKKKDGARKEAAALGSDGADSDANGGGGSGDGAELELEPELPLKELLTQEVFLNRSVYLLGVCYMCVSVLRNGLGDWAVRFLHERWQMDDIAASSCIVLMEMGGFAGAPFEGAASVQARF